MKRLKKFRIFAIALILALLAAGIPALPVFAAEAIAISPAQAQVGATVAYSGSGYPTSETEWYIDIFISDQSATILQFIDIQVTRYKKLFFGSPLNADGTFSGTFTVPTTINEGTLGTSTPLTLTAGTSYYIYACGRYAYSDPISPNKQIKAIATFTVTPAASLAAPSPASGPAGSLVLITGTNFPTNTIIYFNFDTANITPTTGANTTSLGYVLSYITIPATATAGIHYIYATAGNSTASTSFTVTPSAALEPLSPALGPVGTDVLITGTNYPAGAAIAITHSGTAISIKSGSETTVRSTGVVMTHILIPSTAAAGSYVITVTAGTGTATATFTVTASASITLSPGSGLSGIDVGITGANFPVSTTLTFKWDGASIARKSGDTTTSASGSFYSIITVPASASIGTHTITATAGSGTDTKDFIVTGQPTTTPPTTTPPTTTPPTTTPPTTTPPTTTPPTTTPPTTTPPPTTTLPISLNQGGDAVGSPLGIGGNGYIPNSAITITVDNVTVATTTTDANGYFVAFFQIPAKTPHGVQTIYATDGTNTGEVTFTVESTAPQTPQPLAPYMSESVSSPITFDWADIDDASKPVTFNLQIATDKDFTPDSIVIDKTLIESSGYALTEAEELRLDSDVTYYWREKAVDGALNESAWTGANEFAIAKPFEFTGWPLYLTIGVGGLFLFLLGYWLGRRTAFYY